MTKFIVTLGLILTLAIVGSNTANIQVQKDLDIKFVTNDELNELMKIYPSAVEMEKRIIAQPEDKFAAADSGVLGRWNIEYYFGRRAANDFVIVHSVQYNDWAKPQNVEMTLRYPSAGGYGNYITYESIKVRQTTLNGRAVLLSGGPGFRNSVTVITTNATYIFDSEATFFGLN